MNLTLSLTDYAALAPLWIVLGGALFLLLVEIFAEKFSKQFSFYIAVSFLFIALGAAWSAPQSSNPLLTPWLRFDSITHIFTILFIGVGIATTFLAASFFQRFEASRGEYYFLLLSAVAGLIFIGAAADFLTLFLGIETLSISLYILCCYMKTWDISREAATKYFLMGSLAAAFLLYGIALVYGAVGTTRLDALLEGYQTISTTANKALFLGGIALVTLALAFEAAIVPFQLWAPDVYDGSPTPVTAFMAVGTKLGAFAAFVRLFFDALPHFDPLWSQSLTWLIYPTLIYANYLALCQTQLRRFFAYSGISHAGFLLIPVVVGTPEALQALLFYLVIYALATLGAFAVLARLDHKVDGVMLSDLNGLFRRAPVLACVFALCLLTLAGIPPTAGFFAKFFLFKVAFQAGYYALVIVALLTTVLSAYYYLRIIGIMLSESPVEVRTPERSWPASVIGAFSFALIVVLSVYSQPLFSWLIRIDT